MEINEDLVAFACFAFVCVLFWPACLDKFLRRRRDR